MKNGGQAFPSTEYAVNLNGEPCDNHAGMTLRDYFAAKAMAAIIGMHIPSDTEPYSPWKDQHNKDVTEGAYKIADAMLKAREAKP